MHRVRTLLTPLLVACTAGLTSAAAATLERLSMDDMVQKSTAIVRGRVSGSTAVMQGTAGHGIIYTHYTIQVLEQWKGAPASRIDVAVPGGAVQNRRQTFPGAPVLDQNAEYVLFLWTGRSGLTQIIGLSQGLVNVKVDASGNSVLSRIASSEPMVDGKGNQVSDAAFSMSLAAFRSKLSAYGLGGGK